LLHSDVILQIQARWITDDTWNLPRESDYDWSKPHFPRRFNLWKNAEKFQEEAIEAANEDIFKVNIPMRKVDEQLLHYDINDTTESQVSVLYKAFGNIHEWISWGASDKKGNGTLGNG
jgi:RNA recognition motif-containing protein